MYYGSGTVAHTHSATVANDITITSSVC